LQFDLGFLLTLDLDERRAWLEAHQPQDEQQTNWWLGLIQSATLGATLADSVQDRRSHASLVDLLLDEALVQQALPAHEATIRRANLTHALFERGNYEAAFPDRSIDLVVRRCIDALDLTYEDVRSATEAGSPAVASRALELRRAKLILTPLVALKSGIVEGRLRSAVESWEKLLPLLP
jgi:hypothetical protein